MIVRLAVFFVLLLALATYDYLAFAPPGCTNPGYKQINIKYGPSLLQVTPHRKDVYAGDALRFNIISSGGLGGKTVTVSPKDPAVSWPDKSSSSTFVVCVPAATLSGDYKYKVEISDVGELDPVVRIL